MSTQAEEPRAGRPARVVLGMAGLGAAGVAFGSNVQRFLGNVFGSGLGGSCRGATASASTPSPGLPEDRRRRLPPVRSTGLVDKPMELTLDD